MNIEMLIPVVLVLAGVPAALFIWNLMLVRPPAPPPPGAGEQRGISVLVPARNEAANIAPALESVLANRGPDFEVLVLDDDSTDGTAEIVKRFARRDSRVRLLRAPPLPGGWCGKPHACHWLARHARFDCLVFLDADVRLEPDALRRMAGHLGRHDCVLASGVPRQITGSLAEQMLIPLVHFVLLGFLPVWRMRRCTKPAYAAGCGQLFIVDRQAYQRVGGHERIRATLHDGIKLPRLFRRSGYRTDLFDATDVAACRMYTGAREVVAGLMKNAHEALASPGMIVPMTLLLVGGQLLPWVLLAAWPMLPPGMTGWVGAAVGCTLLPRLLAARRFRQPWLGAVLHPVSILLFVGIQWGAFLRRWRGTPSRWRGRAYPGASCPDADPASRARSVHQLGTAS